MPITNERAQKWRLDLSAALGRNVQAARKAKKLSTAELSELCASAGYPIHRVAIGKIESNNRAGKFDVAELITFAKALEVTPASLLFRDEDAAVGWFLGRNSGRDAQYRRGVIAAVQAAQSLLEES